MTVILGLIAALAWGTHDILIRWVSQKSNIFSCLFLVLFFGFIFQTGYVIFTNDFAAIPTTATLPIIASGITFMLAGIGIYKAFEIGPVQLVAPIVATYAIASILWGVVQGNPLSNPQILAIIAVFIGLYIVVSLGNTGDAQISNGSRIHAILWAILSSICFALTFGIGQSMVQYAPETMTILATRVVATLALLPVMFALKIPLFASMKQWKVLAAMGGLDALALSCVLTAGNLPNASYTSLVASLFGMVTILLAWIFLRERMTPLQWVGVIITFAGVAYLGWY